MFGITFLNSERPTNLKAFGFLVFDGIQTRIFTNLPGVNEIFVSAEKNLYIKPKSVIETMIPKAFGL
jgi:hypothetical protein